MADITQTTKFEVKPIYESEISYVDMLARPILKPVLEINKFHESQELQICFTKRKFPDFVP